MFFFKLTFPMSFPQNVVACIPMSFLRKQESSVKRDKSSF
ncbi:hypothetical protein APHACPA_0868 [Rickettsia amblyommatis str. Ac/Pa]|uniref:Uncharacterized protein n=1 Tax=Rickettsia amblyommatis str. Ac/Pa TaxID=1359164 RepID=A0A0F3N2C6_RICAM|nr:hypothetical protein APHACPA_0868 [Rickettsia amblyommatis str. Ac/Pa]